MDFNDLTSEQQELARACKAPEELAELAKSLGAQLSKEELAAVAGGSSSAEDDGSTCAIKFFDCPLLDSCPEYGKCQRESCADLVPWTCATR